MIRNEEKMKKKQLPTIFSMGSVDLIFQLDLTDDDFLNPLSKSINSANNGYPFKFENIKSIKDLYFLKKNIFVWDKILLKGGNPTLNQLLIGNEYLENNKCIIDYVGYGPLKFIKKEEEFFQKIFNYVTKKNFLSINEKYLDENYPSTLTIELTYNNNSLIINYNSQEEKVEEEEEKKEEEEKEEEDNLIESNKKTIVKRNESILFNIEPSIKQYNLVFLNYSDIEKIPGDFQMNDLIELLNFFQKNGSIIFVNFFSLLEKDNEEDNETESNNEKYLQKINEKRMLYNLTNIYFFETLQAQKMFQKHFEYFNEDEKEDNAIIEGDKIFSYFIKNILITSDEVKMNNKNKTSIFLDNLDTLTVISLIKNKSYKNQYNCKIFPELKNNKDLNNNNENLNNFNENNNDDINKSNENSNNDVNNKNDGTNKYNENSNNDINSISDESDDIDIQEQIKEYKEIIDENKIDLYSILISFVIYNFSYNTKNFYLFKIVSKPFLEAFKLPKLPYC